MHTPHFLSENRTTSRPAKTLNISEAEKRRKKEEEGNWRARLMKDLMVAAAPNASSSAREKHDKVTADIPRRRLRVFQRSHFAENKTQTMCFSEISKCERNNPNYPSASKPGCSVRSLSAAGRGHRGICSLPEPGPLGR